jgi:hypothetical protein
MAAKNGQGGKKATRQKSLFRQISKGDLVTIHDKAGERKGHAISREYGNWVLVLERNTGTALATKENTLAVSKSKKLAQPPKVGQRLVYDDGRRSTGEVVEVSPGSMYVRFDNSLEPNLISFDDPEWMDYITFEARGGQPDFAAGVKAEGKCRE